MQPNARTRQTIATLTATFGSRSFEASQAAMCGITHDQLRRAVAVGILHRPRRGWYAVVGLDDGGLAANIQATITQCVDRGARPVIGGGPASTWWQLDTMGPSAPPLLLVDRASGIRPGRRNGVLIRYADLPASHVVESASGQFYTSALRTGIDCARGLDQVSAFIVMNSAVRRSLDPAYGDELDERYSTHRLTDLASETELRIDALEGAAEVLRQCRGNGLGSVRRVQPFLEPRLESALESLSWWRFREWGIPMPTPQAWVRGASGRRYRVDFLFGHVIGEADGSIKYADGGSLWEEKGRQSDLELAGHPVVRWGWKHMWHEPGIVAAALRRAAA